MAVLAALFLILSGTARAAAGDTLPLVPAQAAEVGSADTLWAEDWATGRYTPRLGVVAYAGEHCLIYVDSQVKLSDYTVQELGSAFDTVIYPTLTAAYGSEPNPGLDNDPRVVMFLYDFNDPTNSIDGSFSARDIDPDGSDHSNRREMFYINTHSLLVNPGCGPRLAAHEFSHLIVHYHDVMLDPSPDAAPESTWLAEGFSTYGEHLCGYDSSVNGQLLAFTRDPDFDLTYWEGVRANYGASYAFMTYLADRQGADFIRALAQQPLDGPAGIDATLAATGSASTFASLYDDWVLACFLNSRRPQLEPYRFSSLSVTAQPVALSGRFPMVGTARVVDYGALYLDFPATGSTAPFQAVVDGPAGAPLHAALLSWDSTGTLVPSVISFDLANSAVGGTVVDRGGYDRHTLAVWARNGVGANNSYVFTYSGAFDPPAGIQFLDLGGGDPVYASVAKLLKSGIISGREIPAGSGLWFFLGKDNVSRAQFAKMIMMATGLHTEGVDNVGAPTFKDVPSIFDASGYPYDYIEEAAAHGIVGGYKDGRFGPYDSITRSQLVLMIIRGAQAAGKPLPEYKGSMQTFADVPVTHPYYRQIMTAYKAGILSGSVAADGRLYFYPYASASRNHVAKMTANLVACLETP